MKNFKMLICSFLLVCGGSLCGSITRYYTFDYSTAEYNPINGIQLTFPDMNNYISSGIEIGFPFPLIAERCMNMLQFLLMVLSIRVPLGMMTALIIS
jgi:hypothetical protein